MFSFHSTIAGQPVPEKPLYRSGSLADLLSTTLNTRHTARIHWQIRDAGRVIGEENGNRVVVKLERGAN